MNVDLQFDNLLIKLKEDINWPQTYMFKFIVANENIAAKSSLLILFPTESTITEKDSSGGKYSSLTITTYMDSAELVIETYKKVAGIPGVIAL
jgi:putative lipoic acid-binding regulatory protein